MTPLRLFTLGRLRLEGSDAEGLLAGRRKELVLLAYLARRAPRAVLRTELAALLWESRDEVRARHSLRQALHNLKQAIGEGLEIRPAEVRLREGAVELDATAFEREIGEGRLREAVARWEGDFLREAEDAGGEAYRGWLENERERLRRQLGWTLARLTREAEEQGAWMEAVQWAESWAELLPYDEDAHTRLVEALRLAGRMGEATARHAAFAARLRQEVGEAPSAVFLQLGESLRGSAARPGVRRPGAAALFTPDMVGRGAAFAMLVAAWREAEGGESAALLIEGEEGIGKTRLCQELLRWLRGREQPVLLLQATAHETDADTSHATLRRLLAALPGAPGLAGAPDAALAELSVLLPALRERFPRLPEPSGREAALGSALHEVLRDVGAEVPILLLLDDLPVADTASQRLVLSLVQHAPGSVLILLTGRSELLETTGLGAKLRQTPTLHSRRLQPLSEAEVEALVDSMLALAPAERRPLARRLHAESGGNPLYVIELVTALAEDGLLSLDAEGAWRLSHDLAERALPLPARIQETTRERLVHLDAGARTVLEAAAVLGPRLEPEALEAVADLPPAEFAAALDMLISRRLLRESAAPPLAYEFAHEIVRRVAHEQLSPGRRYLLHRVAARYAREAVELSASAADVVILPFTVAGGEEHRVFGEAMLDLLAAALDGAGGLRCADARRVLDHLASLSPQRPAVERGRQVAEFFGARWFVLGRLLATSGRVRISATVFRTDSSPETAAHITVDGDDTDLLGLLDQTAVELLLRLGHSGGSQLLHLLPHSTASMTALRAYLDGESALRRGELDRAVDSFRAAISHDPEFALAYCRLADALEWTYQPESPRWIAEALSGAARLAERLPEQLRVMVRARHASMRGAGEEAVRLFRSIVVVAPDNVEAWYGLGFAIFHFAQLWGGTVADARYAFEQVIVREPDHLPAAVYLSTIAAVEKRGAEFQALTERILQRDQRSVHLSLRLAIRVQLAYGLPDPELQQRVLEELRSATEADIDTLVFFPLLVGEDLNAAERAITLLAEPGRSPQMRATGHALLASLELARGRWRAAQSQLERVAHFDGALALEYLGLFAGSPFLALPREELWAVRERIGSSSPPPSSEMASPFPFAPHANLHSLLQRYLEGILAVRLEESEAAAEAARWLECAESPETMPLLGRDLAQRIRARAAAARGNPDAALSALDQQRPEIPWHWLAASGVLSGAHERFVRAEQLVRLGRPGEARRWFAAATGLSPFDVVLRAPTELACGEIAEAEGDRAAAARHYRQFVALWSACDPELRPRVDDAARRLARLDQAL